MRIGLRLWRLVYGLRLPEAKLGDDFARLVVEASVHRRHTGLQQVDIIVLTSKIVSKAYSLLAELAKVRPSGKALKIAKTFCGDPRFIQLVLDDSDESSFYHPSRSLLKGG